MIRDIRWAYEIGFKRGWKVGHRRGRDANLVGYNAGLDFDAVSNVNEEPLIQPNLVKGFSSDPVSFDTESAKERKPETYAEYLWRERTEELKFNDLETEVECPHVASGLISETDGILEVMDFDYCPWCGEKL